MLPAPGMPVSQSEPAPRRARPPEADWPGGSCDFAGDLMAEAGSCHSRASAVGGVCRPAMIPGFELVNARAQNIPKGRSNPIPMCMVCIKPLIGLAYLFCDSVDK